MRFQGDLSAVCTELHSYSVSFQDIPKQLTFSYEEPPARLLQSKKHIVDYYVAKH